MKKKEIIGISVLSIIFISMILILIFDKNRVFDEAIYNFIISFRSNILDKFLITIGHFSDTLTIIIVVAILIVIFHNRNSIYLLIMTAVPAIIYTILKFIVRRERPLHLRLIEQGGYSFPSGHANESMAVYGLLIYLACTQIKNKILRNIICLVLGIIIILIGISRIYTGVHYPTDVIAGWSLALIELIVFIHYIPKIGGEKK